MWLPSWFQDYLVLPVFSPWSRMEIDSLDGTPNLLKKLAGSPLFRKTLPNTAAILQQYLEFKRQPGESMANFLVRETLGYEEFSEAFKRLWEEQSGVDPAERIFWLPPISEWDWWDDDYEYGYMGSMDPASGDSDLQHDPAAAPAAAASPEQGAEASASAAPGSSPSHRPPAASEHSAPGPESEVGKPKIPQDVSEVFFGRLLYHECPTWLAFVEGCKSYPRRNQRHRVHLSQNKQDFDAISQALPALWDEQLPGHRYSPHAGQIGRRTQQQRKCKSAQLYFHTNGHSAHISGPCHKAERFYGKKGAPPEPVYNVVKGQQWFFYIDVANLTRIWSCCSITILGNLQFSKTTWKPAVQPSIPWMHILGGLPAPRLVWNASHRDDASATELHLFQLVQMNFGAVGTSDHIPVFLYNIMGHFVAPNWWQGLMGIQKVLPRFRYFGTDLSTWEDAWQIMVSCGDNGIQLG